MTSASLPKFRYHPDPLATGMVKPSDSTCPVCKKVRGYSYVGHVYAIDEYENICPWCIAEGSAARYCDGQFSDDNSLIEAGLARGIVDEVVLRTPGYESWQQDAWLAHCNDACEFHGDASVEDVANVSIETKNEWMRMYKQSESDWAHFTSGYIPRGDSAFYKFICTGCGLTLFGWDLS